MADPIQYVEGDEGTLEELVYMALGAASMCWIPNTGDAVFDSTEASQIGAQLLTELRKRGAK